MSNDAASATGKFAPGGYRTIARQPILGANKAVYGYELIDRSRLSGEHNPARDAQLLFNVLSMADFDQLASRKTLFVKCSHDNLTGGHLDLLTPERAVLEIPPMPLAQVDQIAQRVPILQEMCERGFRLAFEFSVLTKAYEPWLPLASYIKFDLSLLKSKAIEAFVQLARSRTNAKLIADKVDTRQQHALVEALGVPLFQGNWFEEPVVIAGNSIRPTQASALKLLDLVRQHATTAEIEEVLKLDPTLSFNLLRFINSAGFGLRTEVSSFKHAVMLLGLNRLFKWAALLMTTTANRDTPPAVGTTAVVRGRLMELLAQEKLPPEESDNAFVTGVFSLLDSMLGMPLAEALATVNLPPVVTDALLHRRGALAPYLALTEACESGDDAAFGAAADALQLNSSQINLAHLQALAWAETLGTP